MKNFKSLTYLFLFIASFTVQTASALTVIYDFKSPFADSQKTQIKNACKILTDYLTNTDTITLEIKMGNTGGAFATARPYFDPKKPNAVLPFKGELTYDTSSVLDLRQNRKNKTISEPLTIHELMHALGVTSWNPAFIKNVEYKMYAGAKTPFFKGPKMLALNKVSVPLSVSDGSHFILGFRDALGLMPRSAESGGSDLSSLELALLADIGYTVPILNGKTAAFSL